MAQKTRNQVENRSNETAESLQKLDERMNRLEGLFRELLSNFRDLLLLSKEFMGVVRDSFGKLEFLIMLGAMGMAGESPDESNENSEIRFDLIDAKLESVDARFERADIKSLEMKSAMNDGFEALVERIEKIEEFLR